MRLRSILLLASLSALACAAQAAEPGFYVGAGIGNSGIEIDGNDPNLGDIDDRDFDGDDTGYKLLAGFRVVDWFGVEASWNDFGTADDAAEVGNLPIETEFETDGFDLSAMGILPVGESFDLFAKAGYFVWDLEGSANNGGVVERVENDGEDFTYGAGAQWNPGSFGVRAEYQIYDIEGLDDVWFLSLDALFRF
jgi:opacity protein-like surface antigen